MTLINQTAITVCTVPREVILQMLNHLNLEVKLSQPDIADTSPVHSSDQHIIISNCSLITYMSGAPITKLTKLLLVELVHQIDQLLAYFVKRPSKTLLKTLFPCASKQSFHLLSHPTTH